MNYIHSSHCLHGVSSMHGIAKAMNRLAETQHCQPIHLVDVVSQSITAAVRRYMPKPMTAVIQAETILLMRLISAFTHTSMNGPLHRHK